MPKASPSKSSPARRVKADPYPASSPSTPQRTSSATRHSPASHTGDTDLDTRVDIKPDVADDADANADVDTDDDDDVKPTLTPSPWPPPSTPNSTSKRGKAGAKGSASAPGTPSKGGKGEYNKQMLVTLIFAPAQPDWAPIAASTGLTTVQLHDLWRKSLRGSLLENRAWSHPSASFDQPTKINVVMGILEQIKINWDAIVMYFPDRTKSQVSDVWRKVVLPRLKRGEGYE